MTIYWHLISVGRKSLMILGPVWSHWAQYLWDGAVDLLFWRLAHVDIGMTFVSNVFTWATLRNELTPPQAQINFSVFKNLRTAYIGAIPHRVRTTGLKEHLVPIFGSNSFHWLKFLERSLAFFSHLCFCRGSRASLYILSFYALSLKPSECSHVFTQFSSLPYYNK